MNNILIIEDEERVANVIKAYLEKDNYKVVVCNSGMEALETFKKIDFQLIILDLMLPDIDGEEICKAIRRTSNVYIFMLTSKASLNDRIMGLDIGADEYLIKPFSPRELTARVNALFRRINSNNKSSDIYNDGIIKVDYEKRIVERKGKEIQFTESEFNILYTLLLNRGKVLSREQLIENAFGIDFDGYDRTIDVHIKNIRKKIEEDTKNPKYIITVTKVGYKFGGDI